VSWKPTPGIGEVSAFGSVGGAMRSVDQARELLERTGAVLSGHFGLSSGLHSDVYVQKARILERPALTMALAGTIASWYERIDVVVAPAAGAIALGFAVALAAGARSVFAERADGVMSLRRGFEVAPGERALVVEDVVTTGASAREVWELVGGLGAERIGVATLIDRSTCGVPFPMRSVLRVEAPAWDPADCPLCASGSDLTAPGSRHLR
jgi:orotate phosphoribosyltransferase